MGGGDWILSSAVPQKIYNIPNGFICNVFLFAGKCRFACVLKEDRQCSFLLQ